MKRRILSIALVLTIMLSALSLTGCGKSNSEAEEKTTASGTASAATVEDTKNYDPFGKYEQSVKVTGVLSYSAATDEKVPKDTTPETMSFIKAAKEKMNIDFQWMWMAPPDQFDQKFGVALASNELPDVMKVNAARFESLKENEVLTDLTEAVNYASPEFKTWLERDNSVLEACKTDGKLYAVPQYWDSRRGLNMLFVRQDWLKELNLSVPKTMDELKNVAKAFVDKKGAYGIGMSKKLDSWGFDIKAFMNSFGSYPKKWIVGSDGKLVPGEIQPETRNALEFLQGMYKDGLIDKEFGMKDENKVVESVVAGKIGILYGPWWLYEWPLNQSKDKDPKADWVCTEIAADASGNGKAVMDRVQIQDYFVVNKNCKNPEAIVKLFNLNVDFTINNRDEAKPENGYVWQWVPTFYSDPFDINTTFEKFNKAMENGMNVESPEGFTPADLDWWKNKLPKYLKYKEGTEKFNGGDFGSLMARVDKDLGWGSTRRIAESGKVAFNEFYGPSTPTMQEKGSSLDKMTEETFVKIIMNAAPVSEFDKYVENWKKLGGDGVIQEVNQWYEGAKK